MAAQGYQVAAQAWKEAGRPGKPRFVGGAYFGLGPNADERAGGYIRHYYSFMGPMAEAIASSLPKTPEALKGLIKGFEDVGMDELILWPCIPDLEQIDRVREVTG